ncbi:hypothetical protein [Chryseolinea lacunae]|uniref:Uncharacterized protein n=1 Tax=Chryseolinea lacunae TaxID=2801331 RepID=A0ABS1KXJ6_9BACT|nr:hypothetical protein [Chryseolinea lacunae]MBL0744180.1 hypothetical protein [Chryseolinea lacunae]
MEGSKELTCKYRGELRPYLEMLMHHKDSLPELEWKAFVGKTEQSIMASPDQYLVGISKEDVDEKIVHALFLEFIANMGQH